VTVVERAAGVLLQEVAADRGEAIASILDAYSRVGCSHPEVADSLLGRAAGAARELSAPALARLVVASIRLGFEDEAQLGAMLDALVGRARELRPKAVVQLVCALGDLGLSHRALLDAVTEQVVPSRLGDFTAAGLSDMVCALNQLSYYNASFMALMQSHGAGGGEGGGKGAAGGA
jgi:hypothetical protein